MSNIRTALLSGLLLILGSSLKAQVEPQLRTRTDTLDVYKSDAGQSAVVCLMDFSTLSRAVYEPAIYLTNNGRNQYIANAGVPGIDCSTIIQGKDYGYIFLLKKGTTEVRLYRWPQSQDFYNGSGHGPAAPALVGTPYQFSGSSNTQSKASVIAGSSDADTIAHITHVRFTINGRSVDLPCPSQIWDSPYSADPSNPRRPSNSGITNFQHTQAGSDGPHYDPWSEANLSGTNPASGSDLQNIPAGYVPIGNFYYPFDYMAWIFGSKEVGNGFCWSAAPTSGNYASPAGYAVPAATEQTTVPGMSGKVTAEGWFNGLPVMARYQALKMAAINVFLDYVGKVNIVYRYVDGRVDNPLNSEEGIDWGNVGPVDNNPSQSSLWNDVSIRNRKYLRKLTNDASTGVSTNATSLQRMGPSGWSQVYLQAPKTYDALNDFIEATGNNDPCKLSGGTMDPRTPQPWAYALANTYYRTTVEPTKHSMTDIFPASSATCPSQKYVIMFPTGGFTDSTDIGSPTNISEDAAIAYGSKSGAIPSGVGGGVPQIGGNYPGAPLCQGPSATGSLTPGSISFHPAALASVAAFAEAATNTSSHWGAPWEIAPGTTRSSANPGLQTLVVSVGIPGSVYCGSSHNLRSASAQFFRIAQWSDPTRKDLGYGKWYSDKPGYDTSIVDPTNPGQVHYYPSGSPTQLEDNFRNAVAYIVAGSASLSAPATPSTGARVTTQAYFGIFRTSRTPVWSGNLFSVGLKRSLNAAGTTEVLSFYDSQSRNTIASYTPTDALNQPLLDSSGQPIVITGTNDFDHRHLWSAFDIFGAYLSTDYSNGVPPYTDGVAGGSGLLWSQRNVYTLNGSALTRFASDNTTLVNALVAQFTAAGYTPTPTTATVQKFINFIRGQHRNPTYAATNNRIDIMGDIVNSSPLAIELGSDNIRDLPSSIAWPSTGTDPHVRLVLVGTNMGQLHCFVESASTDASGYVKAKATEAWSFIPPDVLNTLYQVYLNDGINDVLPHTYTVDGNPALFWEDVPPSGSPIGNTRVDATEDAIIVFGMRKGARSYYALSLSGTGGTPGLPKFMWKLDPQTSTIDTVKRMGASTATPVFTYISTDGTLATKTAVCFLPGGYANPEINARYRVRANPPITSSQGMGRSMLALDPRTGTILKTWDWSGDPKVGAIPSAVSPLGIFLGYPLVHRIYFADMKGNVMALDSSSLSGADPANGYPGGFRLDTSIMNNWRATPRFIYSNSAFRFSTRPETSLLDSGYPVPAVKLGNPPPSQPNFAPMTAMIAIGSGDWNNPTDADESVSDGTITLKSYPPLTNRMLVFADRQDSNNQGMDTSGIPESSLQEIKDTSDANFNWTTSYTNDNGKVTPGDSNYLFANNTGYYYDLLNGSLPGQAYLDTTHDKVLVSPLIKQNSIFFSIFNINGNSGYKCSSNAFTRTFRECDILRPLGISSQSRLEASTLVGDTDTLNRNSDSCSGLAFFFNSLASEMTDTGDRVIQGGAVTAASTTSFNQQTGSNTASLQNVRDTSKQAGLKLRSWRVVR
ncbi:pilus assembly protein [Geothrix alkalitolerans]|uniref:pilus assembly protein n=1 Tax=Geothrix alkalitolerans TaxID=2922724 RepID=UPI001FAEB0C6|nr:pilus assembly protein [Geothrix alkalitolerans]